MAGTSTIDDVCVRTSICPPLKLGILLGYSLFKFGLSSQWNSLSPWPKFDSSWDASQTWQKDNFIDSNMENHRTREPFFLFNMRNKKEHIICSFFLSHVCALFISSGFGWFYFFSVLNCPEVTSKLAKYDGHVGLARMEGKVCWLETIHVIFSQLNKNSK